MTIGKTIALTGQTFADKAMSKYVHKWRLCKQWSHKQQLQSSGTDTLAKLSWLGLDTGRHRRLRGPFSSCHHRQQRGLPGLSPDCSAEGMMVAEGRNNMVRGQALTFWEQQPPHPNRPRLYNSTQRWPLRYQHCSIRNFTAKHVLVQVKQLLPRPPHTQAFWRETGRVGRKTRNTLTIMASKDRLKDCKPGWNQISQVYAYTSRMNSRLC